MDPSTDIDPMADLEDLGNLFEFGDIDLNTIADSGQFGDHVQQQHVTHPNTPFQELSEPTAMSVPSTQDFGGHDQFAFSQNIGQQPFLNRQKSHAPTSNPYTTESMYQPSIQQTYNPYPPTMQFQPPPGYPPNHHIPPTPNSYEMHGETARFMQQPPQMDQQQRALLEQRYQIRKDDAIAFTPMVSPAGTPQYNMLPEYTIPGAYFSPLTSPMLLAQTQQAQLQQQMNRTQPNTAPNSNTISPIDPNIDLEMLDGVTLPEPAGSKPRRSRRKAGTPKNTGTSGRAKQSPAQQAQKRKSLPLSSSIPHSTPENLLQRSVTSQPSSGGLQMPAQFHSSGESISPEPLSESVMGPPPRPSSSLNVSPVIAGQQQQTTSSFAIGAAATPKSLLATRGIQQPLNGQQDSTPSSTRSWSGLNGLDDLSLPEAAAGQSRRKPSLTQIDTRLVPTDENAAPVSARKTPKLGPLSTPASARPGSAAGSPMIAGSPMAASTPSAILTERKGGRGTKKRGSMSANSSKLVSPALVPKISPSIKPLLPEGTPLNTATQALLLASKSNYQNLLEGNHLPGVTYPDSLSTGLTSKRTSHKVAEQGRRNRINEALKEMQALIPKSSVAKSLNGNGDADGELELGEDDRPGDAISKDDANAKSNSSKAATVELANEYIRKMQKDQAVQNADLVQLRLENEHLKKRLNEQSTPGDSPSSAAGSMASSSQ